MRDRSGSSSRTAGRGRARRWQSGSARSLGTCCCCCCCSSPWWPLLPPFLSAPTLFVCAKIPPVAASLRFRTVGYALPLAGTAWSRRRFHYLEINTYFPALYTIKNCLLPNVCHCFIITFISFFPLSLFICILQAYLLPHAAGLF